MTTTPSVPFPRGGEPSAIRERFQQAFGRPPAAIARAPGRIEFIGNHTDYNGGRVLGAAIDRFVWVAAAANSTGSFRLCTTQDSRVQVLSPDSTVAPDAWTRYPFAVWRSLFEFGQPRPVGFDLLVASDLPAGAGLSSSAALELATAYALLDLAGATTPDPVILAKLARHAENVHVGVPCGILDQATSALGRAGHLVQIDCQGPTFSLVPLPADTALWIFNTRQKHALIDGLYAERHAECQAAAQFLGLRHLCDLPFGDLDRCVARLPAILARRTLHVVEENQRVSRLLLALQSGQIEEAGRLLFDSHRSSRDLFENSTPVLDALVDRLVLSSHTLGARLTGGGFGGAVMAWATKDFTITEAESIGAAVAAQSGTVPDIMRLAIADGAALL